MSTLVIGGTGYIGSALVHHLLVTDHYAKVIDIGIRGNPGNIRSQAIDYADMSQGLIQAYDDIILLAAHSSVQSATADPVRAFRNNVVAFERLLRHMRPSQRLIYASSSSIYSGVGATAASEDLNVGSNWYDASKLMDDMIASLSGKRTYGLRFGTVCGVSPNQRLDIMLPKMVDTAINDGYVRIANPKIQRPILGLNDLCRSITAILDGDGEPGIYNLASFNDRVDHLGAVVAAALDVPLILGEPSPCYDFTISSAKFENEYNFTFSETAESITESLVSAYGGDRTVQADAALSGVR